MKSLLLAVAILLLSVAAAGQQQPAQAASGTIRGIVVGQDGRPAKGIGVAARLRSSLSGSGVLPRTRANDSGEYRFEKLWWGKYAVYADDEAAGYSYGSTGPVANGDPVEVEISPEHPDAELRLDLPPQAGFVEIRPKNKRTGALLPTLEVIVLTMEPKAFLFKMSGVSNQPVLVPPDRNLLLHVSADGFKEWDESVGQGKPIHVASGQRVRLIVPLEPLD